MPTFTNIEIVVMVLMAVGIVAIIGISRAELKHRRAMKTLCELRREAWADAAKKKRSA